MEVRGAIRSPQQAIGAFEPCVIGAIDAHTSWEEALRDVELALATRARLVATASPRRRPRHDCALVPRRHRRRSGIILFMHAPSSGSLLLK
jgi:hypothetical protein